MNPMDDLVQWLHAQLDQEEQHAFTAGNTLGGQLMLNWRAAGSGVEVDGIRRPVNEPLVVTNRFMEDMPGYEVERARALHIADHDPDRVMAEVDAKRQLVNVHKPDRPKGRPNMERHCLTCTSPQAWDEKAGESNCLTLRLLALPYTDRPGYRSEWRP